MATESYVAVTPVRNEASYIREALDSMLSQTIKPVEWVIVDDGSTDQTPEIIREYSARNPWIKLIRLPGTERLRGGHIVGLFYRGLAAVNSSFEYIVKLDGDLSFDPDFFEKALKRMYLNPALGITSGIRHIRVNGGLVEERSAERHTHGSCKIYRKRCLDDIGGLIPAMGWDGVDEIKARMKGWTAEPVAGLRVIHLRPEDKAAVTFRSGAERGRGSYFMGYHPVFLLVRAIKCAIKSPLDGIGMLYGYLKAILTSGERIDDADFIKYLRSNQLKRLFLIKDRV